VIGIGLAERGLVPDSLVRLGIRHMLRQRLSEIAQPDAEAAREAQHAFLRDLRRGPVAPVPELANEQHDEVTPAFFERLSRRNGLLRSDRPRSDNSPRNFRLERP
jgi:cyclopropane-fatty-acyl-phospholipid synthase